MENKEKIMPRYALFKFVVAKQFFETYCPDIKNVKHKLRGLDGNKNPIDFTPQEKSKIRDGVRRMIVDLKNSLPK
jgi:hypothetical protein